MNYVVDSRIKCWATWKDGEPHDLMACRTKKSILISYDMMSLRGLRQTERVLKEKGIEILRTTIEQCNKTDRHAYCLSLAGRLDVKSLEWSIVHCGGEPWKVYDPQGQFDLCFRSAAFYVASQLCKTLSLTSSETTSLHGFHWFDVDYRNPRQAHDGRRRSVFRRLTSEVEEVFEKYSLALSPVRFRQWKDQPEVNHEQH